MSVVPGSLGATVPASQGLYPPTIVPPPAPLSLYRFIPEFVRNPLRALPAAAYTERLVVHGPRGRILVAWITDPALVEQVLVANAGHMSKTEVERRTFSRSVGDSVLTSDGASWRWQRRTLAPLFRHSEILSYVPRMTAAAESTVRVWQQAGAGHVHAIDRNMLDATFSVIANTMLEGGLPAEGEAIKQGGADYLERVTWEIAYGVLRLPRWLPHPASWAMERASRRMRTAVAAIVARRRAGAAAEQSGAPVAAHDLLGRLLAARDPETDAGLSDEQIANNLLTLLAAGHETTAKALTWALYLLACAPEWQERIRAEVTSVAGDQPIGSKHIEQLSITKRVLKEAMRLYPPAPVMARVSDQPIELAGQMIPAGAHLVIPIWCIHRHRKLWDDPDRFEPDRFLPERAATYFRTQYMPFGAGPRICLGMAFAEIEAVVLLATFVRAARFDWDGHHRPEPVSRITLRPKGGMPLIVTPL